MVNVLQKFLTPNWTSSKEDCQWPSTYLLAGGIVAIALDILYTVPFAVAGEHVPVANSVGIFFVFFFAVPAFAFRERTEVLYDGMHLSLRVAIVGLMLYSVAYVASGGAETFTNTSMLASFVIAATASYGAIVLGATWLLKFAKTGTTGVQSDIQ